MKSFNGIYFMQNKILLVKPPQYDKCCSSNLAPASLMFSALPSSLTTYELLAVPQAHILSQAYNLYIQCLSQVRHYMCKSMRTMKRDTIWANYISYIISLSITSKSPFCILQNCSGPCLFGICILGNSPCTGLHKEGIACCSSLKSIPFYSLSETMQSKAKLHQNHLTIFLNLNILWSFQF